MDSLVFTLKAFKSLRFRPSRNWLFLIVQSGHAFSKNMCVVIHSPARIGDVWSLILKTQFATHMCLQCSCFWTLPYLNIPSCCCPFFFRQLATTTLRHRTAFNSSSCPQSLTTLHQFLLGTKRLTKCTYNEQCENNEYDHDHNNLVEKTTQHLCVIALRSFDETQQVHHFLHHTIPVEQCVSNPDKISMPLSL